MRFILIDSQIEDGENASGAEPSPAGRKHATSLAAHLGASGSVSYGPAPRDDYGWEFTLDVDGVSIVFVLQAYGESQWLVPFQPSFVARVFKRARAEPAIAKVAAALEGWRFGPPQIELRLLFEAELSNLDGREPGD